MIGHIVEKLFKDWSQSIAKHTIDCIMITLMYLSCNSATLMVKADRIFYIPLISQISLILICRLCLLT